MERGVYSMTILFRSRAVELLLPEYLFRFSRLFEFTVIQVFAMCILVFASAFKNVITNGVPGACLKTLNAIF